MKQVDQSNSISDVTASVGSKSTNVVTLPARLDDETPSDKVIGFVKRHPLIILAGGLAVGAAVSALLPRRASRTLSRRATGLVETAGISSALISKKARKTAGNFKHTLENEASRLTAKSEDLADVAVDKMDKYGVIALNAVATLGKIAAKRATKLGRSAEEAAHSLSDEVMAQSAKVRHVVDHVRKRAGR